MKYAVVWKEGRELPVDIVKMRHDLDSGYLMQHYPEAYSLVHNTQSMYYNRKGEQSRTAEHGFRYEEIDEEEYKAERFYYKILARSILMNIHDRMDKSGYWNRRTNDV